MVILKNFYYHILKKSILKSKTTRKKIHKELNYKKLKGEWFNLTSQEAIEFVVYFVIRYAEDPLFGVVVLERR